MIKQLRIKAGLGNPPKLMMLNPKTKLSNQVQLLEFIVSAKAMISQKKEIQKAVANLGEYRLTSDYHHLGVESRKFFQMSESQREKIVTVFTSLSEDVN